MRFYYDMAIDENIDGENKDTKNSDENEQIQIKCIENLLHHYKNVKDMVAVYMDKLKNKASAKYSNLVGYSYINFSGE